jgi:hypothetical protein
LRGKLLPLLDTLLMWANHAGHLAPDMVLWLMEHGSMPLYTIQGGYGLNVAESVQRIIVRRALLARHPKRNNE